MARDHQIKIWAEVQSNLEEATGSVRTLLELQALHSLTISQREHAESLLSADGGLDRVTEYLDYNELGLALEELCWIIHEATLDIPESTQTAIKTAAKLMGMDENQYEMPGL